MSIPLTYWARLPTTFTRRALKLHEEVAELVRAPLDLSEYADVLQALMDYAELNGLSWTDVLIAKDNKRRKCGGFLPGTLWKKDPD